MLSLIEIKNRCEISSAHCWIWIGATTSGYGCFNKKRKTYYAHRSSWLAKFGPIPQNLWVLHKCHERRCCNPDHLYLGDHAQNMRDMKEAGTRKGKTVGEKSGRALLTEKEVLQIRKLIKKGMRQQILADKFGVSKSCIAHAANGLNWKHLNA